MVKFFLCSTHNLRFLSSLIQSCARKQLWTSILSTTKNFIIPVNRVLQLQIIAFPLVVQREYTFDAIVFGRKKYLQQLCASFIGQLITLLSSIPYHQRLLGSRESAANVDCQELKYLSNNLIFNQHYLVTGITSANSKQCQLFLNYTCYKILQVQVNNPKHKKAYVSCGAKNEDKSTKLFFENIKSSYFFYCTMLR